MEKVHGEDFGDMAYPEKSKAYFKKSKLYFFLGKQYLQNKCSFDLIFTK
jgi:hypothetical protein